MIQPITEERWQQAQKAEREFHDGHGFNDALLSYKKMYCIYAEMTELKFGQDVYDVLEIGPADIPMLSFFNADVSEVCDPLPSPFLEYICDLHILQIRKYKFEETTQRDGTQSEIWLFNVMQHVQDPEKFIDKAKRIGRTIRFFEPIDWPIEIYHPFSYTIDDYKRWFGDCVQFYKGGSIKGFHEANCAYGVWRAEV